jgi:hypothetical protein
MGYTTSFRGKAEINPPLTAAQILYLRKFCNTRRMKRDPVLALQLPDPLGKALNMPIGDEAGYFVGGTGHSGQDRDLSVLDFNQPPVGQPGLWCSWDVTDDGRYLQWSGAEKFYDYVEWLRYLVEHFFSAWGCVLNGEIEWRGEHREDTGVIKVQCNVVSSIKAPHP